MYVEYNVIDEESDWEGSDYCDDADGVKFNDSEDERPTALDDEFGVNPLDERTSEENKRKWLLVLLNVVRVRVNLEMKR
ncbi:hypothetical protein A2U01_0049432, partial [Trifolium medium]|nr:hypothetical protein [Trifolium medium]